MEGLEAVEVNLRECRDLIDFRIDANTYKKEYIKSDIKIRSKNPLKVSDLAIGVRNFGAYSLCNYINFVNEGIPFLMTENIRHNYINWDIRKYVDQPTHLILLKSHCYKNQVLITMAGEYLGRVAVYDRDEVCSSNQAIAKVTLKHPQDAFVISTFLNSKFGQNQINRFRTITGQPNINMSLIKSILIPQFDNTLKKQITLLVKDSNEFRNTSEETYRKAEKLILEKLGLKNYEPSEQGVNVKSLKNSFLVTGRLDAEYYQPKFDILIDKIKKSPFDSLKNLVTISKSIEPGSDAYQETGIPFYRVSNLTKFGLTDPDIHLDENKYSDIIRPKKDTILLTKDGTVGMAYKVTEDINGITSGAILHLKVKDTSEILPDYLTLVLNSLVVQLQAERDAGGSIIQHWKPSEIGEVIIPILDFDTQKEIADLVQQSFILKSQSEKLLEDAKKLVEMAIEEGEDRALRNYELGLLT